MSEAWTEIEPADLADIAELTAAQAAAAAVEFVGQQFDATVAAALAMARLEGWPQAEIDKVTQWAATMRASAIAAVLTEVDQVVGLAAAMPDKVH